MSDYTSSAERPVLVAASAPEDKRLIMEALDELALPGVLVSDGAEAMQALCRRPTRLAAARAEGLEVSVLRRPDSAPRLAKEPQEPGLPGRSRRIEPSASSTSR
jgi:hypothetical protein